MKVRHVHNKRKTDESATNELEDMEIDVETGVWIQQQKRKNLKINKINRKHEIDLICTSCGKSCDNQSEHEEHSKTHTQSKNCICQKCKKQFTQENELEKHEKSHTQTNLYVCEKCSKSAKEKHGFFMEIIKVS